MGQKDLGNILSWGKKYLNDLKDINIIILIAEPNKCLGYERYKIRK